MRVWHKIVAIATAVVGVIGSIFFYTKGRKHGKEQGRKEVQKEHEKVIQKIQERDIEKQQVNQANVADRLNARFNDTTK